MFSTQIVKMDENLKFSISFLKEGGGDIFESLCSVINRIIE